jgi:hypothetical protein
VTLVSTVLIAQSLFNVQEIALATDFATILASAIAMPAILVLIADPSYATALFLVLTTANVMMVCVFALMDGLVIRVTSPL